MNALPGALDGVRKNVRSIMRHIARALQSVSGGKVSPDMITMVGLLAHLPIAYLIIQNHFFWAAGLLVFFGLFDALDGELARLQQKASSSGMLLDATTDRFKEVILYSAIAYNLIDTAHPRHAVWAVLACGASLCVSYVKAKGETAVRDSRLSANEVNRLFQDGLLRFEIRMFLLVVGLITGRPVLVVAFIAVLASLTAVDRLVTIRKKLR